MQVGLAAVVVGFALGVPLGIMAGFLGGRVEMTIMRLTDMLMAFPTLLLALIIVAALGGSLVNEILAIGIALTPNFTRLARSLALTKQRNCPDWRRSQPSTLVQRYSPRMLSTTTSPSLGGQSS